jgi:SAM-dependent methyltransferase
VTTLDLVSRLKRLASAVAGRGLRAVSGPTSAAEKYWTQAFEQGGITTWMSEEKCRRAANHMVTGSGDEWPMEWFGRVYAESPFDIGLSLGCGDGALERDVRKKGICREIIGIDLSEGALHIAAEEAAKEGLDGITYQRGDFNRLDLPQDEFDVVFFHQAMHHVAELEHCVRQIRKTLKPGGLFYLDEYVGPSRTEWHDSMVADANAHLQSIPSRIRRRGSVPFPIEEDDPSEAVRSSEIVPLVSQHFEVIEHRDYGGNLLALIHPLLRWDVIDDAAREQLLDDLVSREKALLDAGALSYYTVIVARNR